MLTCDPSGLLRNRYTRKPRKWLGRARGSVLRGGWMECWRGCWSLFFSKETPCHNPAFPQHPSRGTLNRYTKRPLQDSAIIFSTPGIGESAFYCANHRVFCKYQQPPGWKIHRFIRWKMPFAVFRSGSGVSRTMTTKFLDNKICTFKILLSWRFPRKTAFWTIFLSAPQGSPPPKAEILFLLPSRRL